MSHADYGIDAPPVIRSLAISGIALLDFMATDEYLATFQSLEWKDVQRSGLNFGMIPPVRVVRGKKPA